MRVSDCYLWLRSRYVLAVAAGLLLALAFPPAGVAGFAWIAPGLLVAAALGKSGTERFRLGYIGGLAHYLALLYWLLFIPYRWQGIPFGPAAGWLALSAFMALFPAAWVWLVAGVRQSADLIDSTPLVRYADVLDRSWHRRALWALGGAAGWVAFEMIRARILGGFPWCLLGVSQFRLLPLIQISSWTGVYGVSFLVAWGSLAFLSAFLMLILKPSTRSVWLGEVFIPILAVAMTFNVGFRQMQPGQEVARKLRVALVQPNIPQTVIWDATADEERFRTLLQQTSAALTNRPDLLLWPEAALPRALRYDEASYEAVTTLARSNQVWFILGSDDMEPRPGAADPKEKDYLNCSFLVSPDGRLTERYTKRNLVIFGEYVPLEHVLPFLKYFTPIQGGYTPGLGPVVFNLSNLVARTSVLICFEDVFPHLARKDVRPDLDFLVNLTNDGWFGESAAPWQHCATAVFRAVENGLPLVRCANSGLTCWIDKHGAIRDLLRDGQGSVYAAGTAVVEIPLRDLGQPTELTFYTRHGDWLGWTCVAWSTILLLVRLQEILRKPAPVRVASTRP